MINVLVSLILSSIAVFVTAHVLPGVHLNSFGTAVAVAIVLGLVNAVIRPILFILTLPINILTLGLFSFVIIGSLVMLTSAIIPGFQVDGFLWAIAFAVLLAFINGFIQAFNPSNQTNIERK